MTDDEIRIVFEAEMRNRLSLDRVPSDLFLDRFRILRNQGQVGDYRIPEVQNLWLGFLHGFRAAERLAPPTPAAVREPIEDNRTTVGIRDAVAYPGLSRATIWKYAHDGALPSFRIGNRRLFRRTDLEEFIKKAEQATAKRHQTFSSE